MGSAFDAAAFASLVVDDVDVGGGPGITGRLDDEKMANMSKCASLCGEIDFSKCNRKPAFHHGILELFSAAYIYRQIIDTNAKRKLNDTACSRT